MSIGALDDDRPLPQEDQDALEKERLANADLRKQLDEAHAALRTFSQKQEKLRHAQEEWADGIADVERAAAPEVGAKVTVGDVPTDSAPDTLEQVLNSNDPPPEPPEEVGDL